MSYADHQDYWQRPDVRHWLAYLDHIENSNLTQMQRHAALVIWSRMRPWRLEVSLSRETLAKRMSCSVRAVENAIAEMRKSSGFCKVVTGGGRSKSNTFKFEDIQKTLFELDEMMAKAPKTTKPKRAKAVSKVPHMGEINGEPDAGFQSEKGERGSLKGAAGSPTIVIPSVYMTDDEQQRSVDHQNPFDEDALRALLVTAAGDALSPAARHGFASLAVPRKWLAAGCDLPAAIVPTIRQVSRRIGGGVQSWDYFTQEVINAKARREAPLPAAAPRAPAPSRTVVDFGERRRQSLAAAAAVAREFGFHG